VPRAGATQTHTHIRSHAPHWWRIAARSEWCKIRIPIPKPKMHRTVISGSITLPLHPGPRWCFLVPRAVATQIHTHMGQRIGSHAPRWWLIAARSEWCKIKNPIPKPKLHRTVISGSITLPLAPGPRWRSPVPRAGATQIHTDMWQRIGSHAPRWWLIAARSEWCKIKNPIPKPKMHLTVISGSITLPLAPGPRWRSPVPRAGATQIHTHMGQRIGSHAPR
jgi:hypothetical protein